MGKINKVKRKGQKGLRGVSYNQYGEVKEKISVTLTPSLIAEITALAEQNKLPRSEFLEQTLRQAFGIGCTKN